MERITLRLATPIGDALRERAQLTDRSVSGEIRQALRQYLATPINSEGAPAGASAKTSDAPAHHAAG